MLAAFRFSIAVITVELSVNEIVNCVKLFKCRYFISKSSS